MALAYYNYEDLPKGPENFHLEYFEEAVNYLLNHPQVVTVGVGGSRGVGKYIIGGMGAKELRGQSIQQIIHMVVEVTTKVKGPGVGLLGISKGGDLCLCMASFLRGITASVIVNGSVINVVGNLHYKGETLPAVGLQPNRITVTKDGLADLSDVVNSPLEGSIQKSFIPLERAESPFLFLVGQDDRILNSEFYANEASKHLQAHGKEKPQIICYPAAGHYIEPPYFPLCRASLSTLFSRPVIWGGEPRAHAMAQVDAWKQLQIFFHKHLGGGKGIIPPKL